MNDRGLLFCLGYFNLRSIFYSAMVEAEREMMLNLTTQHKLGILQRLIT